MQDQEYIDNVLRTESPVNPEMLARMANPETLRLLHAVIGMVTEAGELADALKKHIFYGKPLDRINVLEEVGDSQWYAALAVDILKSTMAEVRQVNIAKLRARFPDKFNAKDAQDRDLANERAVLEQGHGQG